MLPQILDTVGASFILLRDLEENPTVSRERILLALDMEGP